MSSNSDAGPTGPCSCTVSSLSFIIPTEIIRWLAIVWAVSMSVWQYCDITGYAIDPMTNTTDRGVYEKCGFSTNKVGEFWGIYAGIILGVALLVYLPFRLAVFKWKFKSSIFVDENWRPAILIYIILAAVPSFALILTAAKTTSDDLHKLNPVAVTVLQMVVMGLVITEWTAKIQQEQFTYDLMTAMALDFFFAYEVIAFVMMGSAESVFNSDWIYPCFVFTVVAMFKYLPTEPVTGFKSGKPGVSRNFLVHVVVSMVCCEIPFVVIRLSTMIIFKDFLISDMIFLLKNFFILIFNCIQIGLIYQYWEKEMPGNGRRLYRGPDEMCNDDDPVCRVKVGAMNNPVG